MDKKNKDIFKKAIDQTSADFTSKVMKQIDKEELALKNVLQNHAALEPSSNFTSKLMTQLDGKVAVKPYKNIISRKAWVGIAAAFTAIIIAALSYEGESQRTYAISDKVQNVSDSIMTFLAESSTLTYTLYGILIFSVVLLIDQRRNRSHI